MNNLIHSYVRGTQYTVLLLMSRCSTDALIDPERQHSMNPALDIVAHGTRWPLRLVEGPHKDNPFLIDESAATASRIII